MNQGYVQLQKVVADKEKEEKEIIESLRDSIYLKEVSVLLRHAQLHNNPPTIGNIITSSFPLSPEPGSSFSSNTFLSKTQAAFVSLFSFYSHHPFLGIPIDSAGLTAMAHGCVYLPRLKELAKTYVVFREGEEVEERRKERKSRGEQKRDESFEGDLKKKRWKKKEEKWAEVKEKKKEKREKEEFGKRRFLDEAEKEFLDDAIFLKKMSRSGRKGKKGKKTQNSKAKQFDREIGL
eukprot:gnl/Carplike_NY0171/4214_a5702_353.p1 GENE.gnl/Carplike_NY0171/4214_a5702_353~~gnl/Carplike_NY0171/4214_a5702_353.p1  ORF type:complete len:235 (-),score=77.45 gnl/Carplike_NY0171/4214_a5702_353:169-873(-)